MNFDLLLWSLAVGLYVVGYSFVAKVEEPNALRRFLPVLLILLPAALFQVRGFSPERAVFTPYLVIILYLAWAIYCLILLFLPTRRSIPRAVARMQSGACLVALLAVSQIENAWFGQVLIIGLFVLALAFQRRVPLD